MWRKEGERMKPRIRTGQIWYDLKYDRLHYIGFEVFGVAYLDMQPNDNFGLYVLHRWITDNCVYIGKL